jgi:hypothetical protein
MKFAQQTSTLRRLSVIACAAALAACGAGSDQTDSSATQTAGKMSNSGKKSVASGSLTGTVTTTVPTTTTTTTTPPTTTTTTNTTTTSSSAAVTDVRFENTSAVAETNVPVTFGQVFAVGHLKAGEQLTGRLDDGTTVPLQVDVKATHADGSIRHAVISAVLPNLAASTVRTMSLVKSSTAAATAAGTTIDTLMQKGFSFSVHTKIGGVDYYASADELLKKGGAKTWLSGPIATEWQVAAPLQTSSGAQHPHLQARFAIRFFPATGKARVDVTVENDWAYEPSPQNFTYDASAIMAGKSVYSKLGMTHYHHARWRKMFWFNGAEPAVNVKLNTSYLIDSKALPNYDRSLTIAETALASMQTKWTGAITEPMAAGMANTYMPGTGGRDDIGLMPGWTVDYLLSMDKRARTVTMGTADLSGSWSSHYRDRNTDRPVSLMDYPYMTILGMQADTLNRTTGKYEAFPKCATTTACTTPLSHDSAHQPNFAYLPYLVTGDYYYLEELQFWTMWNLFSSNPNYRQAGKGLVNPDQVRGQAWSMRTLSEAAYITPDSDPLKAQFKTWLSNNLDWYNTTYTQNPSANVFGVLTNGAFVYSNGTGLAAWQDDFFTSAIGHAVDLGFDQAKPLLVWKAKYPAQRMLDPQTCWIDGALYSMVARDTSTSPMYTTWAQVSKASRTATFNSLECGSAAMASFLGLKVGEMTGYSTSPMGYPSNMQPALAYGASLSTTGMSAWTKFMARSVKPDYRSSPQFAIVPR